jgi:putative hydrolase of the HAD superfamily
VSVRRSAGRGLVWFFDLDDTLHQATPHVFARIDERMTGFVARHLGLETEAASALREAYWSRYGATLMGLVRHHGVAPAHFLRETHDFDLAPLVRTERGAGAILRALPGRKLLLTNAPGDYARRVLECAGLAGHFPRRLAVEQMRLHGHWRPKPSRSMLRAMLAREGLAGRRRQAVLVDDQPANLKSARALGMRTVLRIVPGRRPRAGSGVDARVRSLRGLQGLAAAWTAAR